MRRFFLYLAVVFCLSFMMESCRSKDICPAYDSSGIGADPVVRKRKGKADQELFGKEKRRKRKSRR